MDRSAVQAVIDANLGVLREVMSLALWDVRVNLDSTMTSKDGWLKMGCVEWKYDYQKASIQLNPDTFDSPEEVVSTLRHELIHLVIGSYDQLYSSACVAANDNPKLEEVIEHTYRRGMEQAVLAVERTLDNLQFTPANILSGAWVRKETDAAPPKP